MFKKNIKKVIDFLKKHQVIILIAIISGLIFSFLFNLIKRIIRTIFKPKSTEIEKEERETTKVKQEDFETEIEKEERETTVVKINKEGGEKSQTPQTKVIDRKSEPKFEKLLKNTDMKYRSQKEDSDGWWAQAIDGEIIPIIYKRPADTWIFPY